MNEREDAFTTLGEFRTLQQKHNRTKEEEDRYIFLARNYFPPPTRAQRELYKRIEEESKGFLTAKKVDLK